MGRKGLFWLFFILGMIWIGFCSYYYLTYINPYDIYEVINDIKE